MRPKAEWAIDSEAMRESKIQLVAQKTIETKHLSQIKANHQSFLPPKHYKCGGRFSLLVGYNIEPTSSSTNQDTALMIDH